MRHCVDKIPTVYIPVYRFTQLKFRQDSQNITKLHARQQTIEIISENSKMIVQDCTSCAVKLPTVQIFGMTEGKV